MGLFDKLFSKKGKVSEEKKEQERISIDSPYGKFYYFANPAANEYGYEGYVEWYPNGIEEESTEAYIETDTSETTESGICFSRFEKLFSDKERIDYEMKKSAADYFLFKPDLLIGETSEEELIGDMEIIWIGVYRSGDTKFSIDASGLEADEISVALKADGSKEISYIAGCFNEYKEYCDKL